MNSSAAFFDALAEGLVGGWVFGECGFLFVGDCVCSVRLDIEGSLKYGGEEVHFALCIPSSS